jgi:hypothetical protein
MARARVGVLVGVVTLVAGCGGGGGDALPRFDSAGDVAIADLDGDGRPDVVATVSDIDGPPPHEGIVKVWLQRADAPGSFHPATHWAVGPDPWELRVADVDGDRRPDLVVMSSHASAVAGAALVDAITVLRADPASPGSFRPPTTLHAGLRLVDIALADLDGDDLPDIAYTGIGDAGARLGLFWSRAAAPGRFEAPVDRAQPGAGALVAADLDADGRRDLAVVGGADGDQVWLHRRDPASARGLLAPVQIAATAAGSLTDLLATDLDRDGRADLVLGTRSGSLFGAAGELVTLRQDAQQPGRFETLQRLPLARHTWEGLAADVDGDGRPDLVASGAGWDGVLADDVIEVFPGLAGADARFGAPVRTVSKGTSSGWHLAAGDLDGDGRDELAMPFGAGVLLWRADPAAPGRLLRGDVLR